MTRRGFGGGALSHWVVGNWVVLGIYQCYGGLRFLWVSAFAAVMGFVSDICIDSLSKVHAIDYLSVWILERM